MAKRLSIILVGIVALLFLLSGCSILRELTVNDVKETEKMTQRIVSALDARDEDALKAVLSPRALEEANDLDEGIQYILSLYQGPSVEIENRATHYPEHYGSPGYTLTAKAHFSIKTESEEFVLAFEYRIIDNADPKMEGVYRLNLSTPEEARRQSDTYAVIKTEAYDNGKVPPEWNYGATYNRPGIYHPGWEDELPPDVVTE